MIRQVWWLVRVAFITVLGRLMVAAGVADREVLDNIVKGLEADPRSR